MDQDENELLDKINRYLWVAGLIAFFAAILLGLIITRQITRPLKSLTRGAEQIARGNLNYRVDINTRDEVGELGRSFNQMAANLEKSEQSRKRLVSDVTHELRTPLTIIEGTVDGMMDGVFPADPEHLNNIKEQSTLLTRLVSDLRDLSLAESGQLKLQKSAVNLVDLLKTKISHFEPLAAEKKIVMNLQAQCGPPDIEVDPYRIDQVITNLLSNAIRHTPPGGRIDLTVSIDESQTSKPGKLVLTVSDTGEGIAAEHIPHIFDRFYRVAGSRSRSEGGAGLGLAIVKQMVEAHGGSVEAASQPGLGTTFKVTLPIRADSPDKKRT